MIPSRSRKNTHSPPVDRQSRQEPALLLIIRPSLSLPDIHLDIDFPHTTPVALVKQQIRERLGPKHRDRKVRLIYQGKILPDGAVLGDVVKPPAPPPKQGNPDDRDGGDDDGSGNKTRLNAAVEGLSAKAKGKMPITSHTRRVFVNASIGDVLSRRDLEAEAKEARKAFHTPPFSGPCAGKAGVRRSGPARDGRESSSSSSSSPSSPSSSRAAGAAAASLSSPNATTQPPTTTNPAPRGFDRLLSTPGGFTRAEVAELRLQFRNIQASRHAADDMPSPDTLRTLEDAWLDSSGFGAEGLTNSNTENAEVANNLVTAGVSEEETVHRVLDTAPMAMAVGFFWPLGTVMWLARQEGMWSRTWHFLALLGFVMSLMLGIVKNVGGGGF